MGCSLTTPPVEMSPAYLPRQRPFRYPPSRLALVVVLVRFNTTTLGPSLASRWLAIALLLSPISPVLRPLVWLLAYSPLVPQRLISPAILPSLDSTLALVLLLPHGG